MSLDYEDFASGGMSIRNPSRWLPYSVYKHSAEFREKQLWKTQADSRNPNGTEHRYWELRDKDDNLTGNHVHEVRGLRICRGQCKACGDVVLTVRDVSGPEFRGRRNPGIRGRWPVYCRGSACQERRHQKRAAAQSEGMERLRAGERRLDYRPRKPDHELKNPRR
ncbi:hypothetical protein ABQF34_07215 [Mycolicibacterium boenickei]